jgi:hypothetical protein
MFGAPSGDASLFSPRPALSLSPSLSQQHTHHPETTQYTTDTAFDHTLLDRSLPAEQQLDALLRAGAARRAALHLRHLARVLAAASLSQPAQVLLGLPKGGGYAHVMFVYRNPRGTEPFDDSLGLSFKLPVREEDDEIEGAEAEEEEEEALRDAFAFDARAEDRRAAPVVAAA